MIKHSLNMRSREPLYKQIERDILQCLAEGEWRPGAQLPIESELAKRFGVAIYTVRAGIGKLVGAGILARKQGKGTFVAHHQRDRARQHFSHVFDVANRKVVPTLELVTSFRKQRADKRVAGLLCLDGRKDSAVFHWETVVKVNQHAVSLRHTTVPVYLFPSLTARALRNNKQNTYALYQDLCGLNVIRMEDRVRAIRADSHEANVLGLKRGDPLLQIDRLAFTYNDLPVELRTRVYDSTNFYYHSVQPGI
ncbi:MAG: GntR family transcriptional regulator [Burkholderiales bacterium]